MNIKWVSQQSQVCFGGQLLQKYLYLGIYILVDIDLNNRNKITLEIESPDIICEELISLNIFEKEKINGTEFGCVLNSLIYENVKDKINSVMSKKEQMNHKYLVKELFMAYMCDVIKKRAKLFSDSHDNSFIEYVMILIIVALESTDLDKELNLKVSDFQSWKK